MTGIEITAVDDGRDVHVLGYFFDPDDDELNSFLRTAAPRASRARARDCRAAGVARLRDRCRGAVGDRFRARAAAASAGRPSPTRWSLPATPSIAGDAFDRLLGSGRPAFVPRRGPGVAEVVATIAAAGGIASLAHPGLMGVDDRIPAYAAAGLSAIEVRHRDHN